jgi:hypothetical protein
MVALLLTFVLLLSFMICVLIMMMFVIYWRVFALVQLMICETEERE